MATINRKDYFNRLRGHLQDQIRRLPENRKPTTLRGWIELNRDEAKNFRAVLQSEGTDVDMSYNRGPNG